MPHLTSSGELVNRATLERICLGVGIIMSDAQLIQFTEDEDFGQAPDYIATSHWAGVEYGKIHDYIHRLHKDLSVATQRLGYVVSVTSGLNF